MPVTANGPLGNMQTFGNERCRVSGVVEDLSRVKTFALDRADSTTMDKAIYDRLVYLAHPFRSLRPSSVNDCADFRADST
jgi:hypothetical protein